MPRHWLVVSLALCILVLATPPLAADALDDARAGNQAFAAGDHDEAVEAFSRAIQSRELTGDALAITLNNRGVAYGELGDFDRAMADYRAALDLRPGDATTLRNLRVALTRRGFSHANLGEIDLALRDYQTAIELDPTAALPHIRRAQLLTDIGEFERARRDLDRADELEPGAQEAIDARSALEQAVASREQPSPTAQGDMPDALEAEPANGSAASPASPAPRAQPEPQAVQAADATGEEAAVDDPTASVASSETAARPSSERVNAAASEEGASDVSEPAGADRPASSPGAERREQVASTEAVERFRTIQAVNFRAGPDNDAERLGTMAGGRVIEVVGDELGWKRFILSDGREAYIYQRWLERVSE